MIGQGKINDDKAAVRRLANFIVELIHTEEIKVVMACPYYFGENEPMASEDWCDEDGTFCNHKENVVECWIKYAYQK